MADSSERQESNRWDITKVEICSLTYVFYKLIHSEWLVEHGPKIAYHFSWCNGVTTNQDLWYTMSRQMCFEC